MKYAVDVREVHTREYHVDADSPSDAAEKVYQWLWGGMEGGEVQETGDAEHVETLDQDTWTVNESI